MSLRRATSQILLALVLASAFGPSSAAPEAQRLVRVADALERLHSLLVLHRGEVVVEYVRGGPGLDAPASIKSLSKTVLSALAGIAIDRGFVPSVDRPVVELLDRDLPSAADPRVDRITLGHALSLRAGLRSTSGRYYGAWVQSDDWVNHVLTRPFVAEPGGRMIYSTGSSHLVAAALAAATGRSLRSLARDWLGAPLGIRIPDWMTDPQGIHFGGNQMLLSPRAIARLGETYRCGGRFGGSQVVPADWVRASWTAYGTSPWSGDDYGYGWFITELAGERVYYGRGYGGQALFVVPSRALTLVVTSDPTPPSPGGRYFSKLRRLAAESIRGRAGDSLREGC
ncbi:MAG: serine hydrolase domain-containing protein [Candidatus Wenzhouxiangella sp. M2_3B_020]